MAQHVQLKAETRDMLGKKVRRLRKSGILPATVYGHDVTPVSIQVVTHDLMGVLRHAGRTQLIDLTIDQQAPRPVFVRQTEVDAKRNQILHVEFYQANLREPLKTTAALHFTGDAPAVRDGGIFLTLLDHVEIESLPDNVPAGGLEIDISELREINTVMHASDITLPSGVTLLTSPDEVIAKVDAAPTEEAVAEVLDQAETLPAELGGDETPPDAVPEA